MSAGWRTVDPRAGDARRRNIALAVMVALAGLWLLCASRVHVNASWSDEAWGYAAFPLFGEGPAIGERVLFDPPEALASPVPYLKSVRGVPGMRIDVDRDGTVFLDGVALGRAKTHALDGRPLAAIPEHGFASLSPESPRDHGLHEAGPDEPWDPAPARRPAGRRWRRA